MQNLLRRAGVVRALHQRLVIDDVALDGYSDLYTPEALKVLNDLAIFETQRRALLESRTERRQKRLEGTTVPNCFLDPEYIIPNRGITVAQARNGEFEGSPIPSDLQRQWVQGTGPAARPRSSIKANLRNVAYALLSGADGWMFDGEDACGQTGTMALDAHRSLKAAISLSPIFQDVATGVAKEMNDWSQGFYGKLIIPDVAKQLEFTTRIYRARGMHLDDRHVGSRDGGGFSASITDAVMYVVHNHKTLAAQGRSIVLYLPKIQHVAEAAFWDDMLSALEDSLGLRRASIRTYVLVEQLEASHQLLEIRAALGQRFVGFNTGRWDYINSVSDLLAGVKDKHHPNITTVTMSYAYMAAYEDRVRRAVNTPDKKGLFALWQGGMEPQIPVGSAAGVKEALRRAVLGAEREQAAGASGKWVAHWKMVHTIRPVWERAGEANQMGRKFPALTHTAEDNAALTDVAPGPRTIAGARDLLSVAMQYGNAFGRGFQAAALKPADFFGDDNVLYLMEDMATGEIRMSILWEWLHKGAKFTEDDPAMGVKEGDLMTEALFLRLLEQEYTKLQDARNVDVHDDSKATTLPIAKQIVRAFVMSPVKLPWYADLLYLCLDVTDAAAASQRVTRFISTFAATGRRITENLNFSGVKSMTRKWSQANHTEAIAAAKEFMTSPRFDGIQRVYTAREVAEQRGTFSESYNVAREAAEGFYARLRELYSKGETILTFGPYSPGQAVAMKKAGIEGIYLGGWATSAKGSLKEDPGPDLASYPLSQVPEEAGHLVRALLVADKNQYFTRSRMTAAERAANPEVDFRPFIVADADTGHGGDAHVRNLIRRFAEVGVAGYHIEDQKPGVKKCGHQGGKVLVSSEEQIKRMNAARFQLDVMGVPGIIVARTDAEAATLLDGRSDERDQPFILGVTNKSCPTFRVATLRLLKLFFDHGVTSLSGHLMYDVAEAEMAAALKWFEDVGVAAIARELAVECVAGKASAEAVFEKAIDALVSAWQPAAGVMTYAEAIAAVITQHASDGTSVGMTAEEWLKWAKTVGWYEARQKASELGCEGPWDPEHAKTPDGYYQVRGGIDYAIQKSLAVAPFCDLLWMETKTADLAEAKKFADAIHAVYPEKMLAYNMSPSFNWDTTGMADEDMRQFANKMGKLGFVFNFITYGGHQIDGAAGEEFAASLKQDGMLALAKLQRKFRLVESPYRTPQTLVGGPRADAALSAVTGHTATTKAMGQGSTQHQHLVQVEVPVKLLEGWLEEWRSFNNITELGKLSARLRPHSPGSEILELTVLAEKSAEPVANIVFSIIRDRRNAAIMSVRDQNNFDTRLRGKRLLLLVHLFLMHRYKIQTTHYLEATEMNEKAAAGMAKLDLLSDVHGEVGGLLVARCNTQVVTKAATDAAMITKLITKST